MPEWILGIETSCDETSAAVVRSEGGRRTLASVTILSQDIHKIFGGVVPELASRAHVPAIGPVIDRALAEAGIGLSQLDGVAVTAGPGLAGALMVGVAAAKAYASALQVPLYGVNHLAGHVAVDTLEHGPLPDRCVALLVSGGHTSLLQVDGITAGITELGSTTDDAAGEAYDKVARLLGLPYPGGPEIDRAATGDPRHVSFPRGLTARKDLERHRFDFSFSGLKTAVLTVVKNHEEKVVANICEQDKANIARGFVDAIVDVLTAKCVNALKHTGLKRLVIAGGVGANRQLRESLNAAAARRKFKVYYPELEFCTDNGAMIAFAAAMRLQCNPAEATRDYAFTVLPRWPLEDLRIGA